MSIFRTKSAAVGKEKRRKKQAVNPELEREWNLNREGFRDSPRAYLEMIRHCGKIEGR